MLRTANRMQDPVARAAYLKKAEQLALSAFPVIPLFVPSRTYLVSKRVQGWETTWIHTWHATCRSRTEHYARGAAAPAAGCSICRIVPVVAGCLVTVGHLMQRRGFLAAPRRVARGHRVWKAQPLGGSIGEGISPDKDDPAVLSPCPARQRNCAEQCLCIRMPRVCEQFIPGARSLRPAPGT